MLTTLRTNIKNPERRKIFYARLGGKLIGVAAVIGAPNRLAATAPPARCRSMRPPPT